MANDDTRKRILDATKNLLLTLENPESITARQIAAKAEVNLAMINYCFQSKEKLLKTATDEIITNEFSKMTMERTETSAKERLKMLLFKICEITLQFEKITRLSVPYLVFEAPIELPLLILPYVKEHFGEKADESRCRMISFELVTVLQIVLYRKNEFSMFAGVPLKTSEDFRAFINRQVNLLLGDE